MSITIIAKKPCQKCGGMERKVRPSGTCVCPVCHRAAVKRYYQRNIDKVKISHRAYWKKKRDGQFDCETVSKRRAIEDHMQKTREESYYDID